MNLIDSPLMKVCGSTNVIIFEEILLIPELLPTKNFFSEVISSLVN
jgi:hypothetical protein